MVWSCYLSIIESPHYDCSWQAGPGYVVAHPEQGGGGGAGVHHRAQAGDDRHQDADGQHRVSVGGDGDCPGVGVLLVVVVVEEVWEDDEGDGGEGEEDRRDQEESRGWLGDVSPAQTDLSL